MYLYPGAMQLGVITAASRGRQGKDAAPQAVVREQQLGWAALPAASRGAWPRKPAQGA